MDYEYSFPFASSHSDLNLAFSFNGTHPPNHHHEDLRGPLHVPHNGCDNTNDFPGITGVTISTLTVSNRFATLFPTQQTQTETQWTVSASQPQIGLSVPQEMSAVTWEYVADTQPYPDVAQPFEAPLTVCVPYVSLSDSQSLDYPPCFPVQTGIDDSSLEKGRELQNRYQRRPFDSLSLPPMPRNANITALDDTEMEPGSQPSNNLVLNLGNRSQQDPFPHVSLSYSIKLGPRR